jgi:hypothetical protein
LFIAASALPSGRLIMVFDLTLPGFSGKFLFILSDYGAIKHRGGMNYHELDWYFWSTLLLS